MTDSMTFTVPFTPVAKGRARTTWTNQGPRHYTPEKTRHWERTVKTIAAKAMRGRSQMTGAPALSVAFFLPIPLSWPAWKRKAAADGAIAATGKPDASNLAKAVEDAMNGTVWADDAQIVQMMVWKAYAHAPRVEVCVTRLAHLLPAQVTTRPTEDELRRMLEPTPMEGCP